MQQIKLSEATANNRWVAFQVFDDDSADAYAPKTGLTFAAGELRIAKRGSAAANATNHGSVVEAGNGMYWYQLAAGEVDTLGPLLLVVNKTDCYPTPTVVQIVAHNVNDATALGLSRLDATITSRLADADYDDADAILDLANGIETGLTPRQALRLIAAVAAGKVSGAGTGTEYVRNAVADTKARITATVDSSGNRTAMTTDLT